MNGKSYIYFDHYHHYGDTINCMHTQMIWRRFWHYAIIVWLTEESVKCTVKGEHDFTEWYIRVVELIVARLLTTLKAPLTPEKTNSLNKPFLLVELTKS